MKEKIAAFFRGKTFLIFFSIACAVISWFFVLNYTNPIVERTLEIPITVINEDSISAYSLVNTTEVIPETANVTVSGRKSIVDNLTSYDFKSYINLAEVSEKGTKELSISRPECEKIGVTVKKYSPTKADFSFDKKEIVNLKVEVYYSSSLCRNGYRFLSVTPDTETIQVRGFSSDIEKLDCIRVDLDEILENGSVDSNKTASYIGKFIAKNGENVSQKFEQVSIIVKMEVGKDVTLVYGLEGDPMDDYYVNSDSISANKVTLQGNPNELDKIDSVNLGRISVEGENRNFEKEINISSFLPDGVTVYGSSKVSVSVEILKVAEKTIKYSVDDIIYIGKNGSFTYELVKDGTPVTDFYVTVKGIREDVESLKESDIRINMNLLDNKGNLLGAGEYPNLKLSFKVDNDNVYVSGEYIFDVIITKISPA